MRRILLAALVVAGAACSSDGAPTPTGPTPVPILSWVTEMVDQTADDAMPDTVEDKVIADTDDPAAFDSFLVEN